MKKLPKQIKIFFILIYILTIFSLYFFMKGDLIFLQITSYKNIIFFAILAFLTETFTFYYRSMSFSTSFAITLASYILFGIDSTLLVIILGYTFRVLKTNEGKYKHIFNTPFYGTLSNYCILIIPKLYGHAIYIYSGGTVGVENIQDNIILIFMFSIISFLINNLIISVLTGLSTSKNILFSFGKNLKLLILNFFIMAPMGILLAIIFKEYSYFGVIILTFPIILARYTFSLYTDVKTQYTQTVNSFMYAVEAKDKYTEGHSQRVAEISRMIGKELGYSQWKLEQLDTAALLHDIGKIGIIDSILNKPGKLTAEEYTAIKQHTTIGYSIIKDIKNLGYASSIVLYHHERYDGKGYPEGKKGEELHIDVFIVQLADAVDAMSSDRPYRKALSKEDIVEEVKNNTGTQFHPKIVKAYLNAIGRNEN